MYHLPTPLTSLCSRVFNESGATPRKQSTWHSTVPLRLPALLATPEWSTEDGYGCDGSGTDGGDGGSISEFRRQRRLDHDKMYRDAISSTLSTFSQARGAPTQCSVHSAQCTVHRVHSNEQPLSSTALERSQPFIIR